MQQAFLVSEPQKALVLNPAVPEMLCNLLPMAKSFPFRGHTLYAVPHDVDVVRLLRNVGVPAPSPILHQYTWPGKYKPFQAQRETAAFLTLNPRAFVLNDMGCFDATTEYLSPTGWKRFDQYDGGQVAQYHPETRGMEFVDPTEYVKLPCPEMIRIKTARGVDQLLSPEHRVLLTTRDGGKTEVLQAHELLARHDAVHAGTSRKGRRSTIGWTKACVPATFRTAGGVGVPLTDAQMRVQIAVIADGHFANGTSRCCVRLKRERKVARLRQLLDAAHISFDERRENSGFFVFKFYAPTRDKEFGADWWQATAEQLRIVTDEVMHWDGSISQDSTRGPRFSSTSKASADFVQYAFAATGSVARITVDEREYRTGPCYQVQVRPGVENLGLHGTLQGGAPTPTMRVEPSPDGFKYCFMVPSTFLVVRRNGCVFASGNTGKTMATMWAYDYLRSIGKRKRMLVVSPLSTLERTWGDTIFTNFPHLTFTVLHGTKDRRMKLLNHPFDVYIINHDGLEVIAPGLYEEVKSGKKVTEVRNLRPDIDVIVIDEIAVLRNSNTDRYRVTENICKVPDRIVWGLTGTPIPNEPTDAWAQIKLIDATKVPKYFGRFRDMVMSKINAFKYIAKKDALDTVLKHMQPAIRFSREDCVDLPETLYQTRHIALTAQQKKVYEDIRLRMKADEEAGTVRAVNEADKLMKLVQVAAGAVYTTEGEIVDIDNAARVAEVKQIIEQSEGKVIVFVPFIAALKSLREELAKDYATELVYGGTSKGDRDTAFWRFMNLPASESRVLVANAAAMSHGLTLTEASTIVWMAPTTSHETFDQANHRIIRPGQKRKTLIVMLEGTDVERKIYARLQQRQTTQGLLLDAVRAAVD